MSFGLKSLNGSEFHEDRFLTCEAGVSLKPGASAPGTRRFSIKSPRMRAKAYMIKELPPVITGYDP